MSPLLMVILAFVIGFVEWYLALRRTLALTHGEKWLTFNLVLVEGILAWTVLSSFLNVPTSPIEIEPNDNFLTYLIQVAIALKWKISMALSASFGGGLGSLMVKAKEVQ